jgi:hypothetical protein
VIADSKDTSRRTQLFYRQSAWTRVTHWIWAVTLFFMVASGLQIFNAHPILYIGRQSGFGDKPRHPRQNMRPDDRLPLTELTAYGRRSPS